VDKPKRKAKRKYLGKDSVVNEYGELLAEYHKWRDEAKKTIYVSMYLNDEDLYDTMSGLGNLGKVWAYVLVHYDHRSGVFNFSGTSKIMMVQELNLSAGTIRSAIKGFCDSKLLVRVIGSDYLVNPHKFYKGDWENRPAQQKLFDQFIERNKTESVDKRVKDEKVGS
jgi:hypothetical protein